MRNKERTGSYKRVYFLFFFIFYKSQNCWERKKLIAILHSYIKRKNKCLNERINFYNFPSNRAISWRFFVFKLWICFFSSRI